MFNIMRLSIARKRRQMTKAALAKAAGLSSLTLTRIENGVTIEPDAGTVSALARALAYPEKFFYQPDGEEPPVAAVSFRSLTSLTARQRDAALAAAALAEDLESWVTTRFNVTKADVPDLRGERPEAAAEAVRRYWGIGYRPIANVVQLLEAKGIRVFSLAESNKNVDAYSYWHGDVPFVFLNTFKSAERSRFDAAHELGHIVMHKHGGPVGREAERDADRFAAALMVPPDDLRARMPRAWSVSQLVKQKARWGVSVAALAHCAFAAGTVSEWGYRGLCRELSALGYRTHEPEPCKRDTSMFWKQVLSELWRERITHETIAEDLGLPLDEALMLVSGLLENHGNDMPPLARLARPSLCIV